MEDGRRREGGGGGGQNPPHIPEEPDIPPYLPGTPRPDLAAPIRPATLPSPVPTRLEYGGPDAASQKPADPPLQEVIEQRAPPALAQYPPDNQYAQTSPASDQSEGNPRLLSPEGQYQGGAEEPQQVNNPIMDGDQVVHPPYIGEEAVEGVHPLPPNLNEDVGPLFGPLFDTPPRPAPAPPRPSTQPALTTRNMAPDWKSRIPGARLMPWATHRQSWPSWAATHSHDFRHGQLPHPHGPRTSQGRVWLR